MKYYSQSAAVLLIWGLAACTAQEVDPEDGDTGGEKSETPPKGDENDTPPSNDTETSEVAEGTVCLPPAEMLADFAYDGAADTSTEDPRFGAPGESLSGGGSVYGGFTSDITANDWHLSGTIDDYSGFALYFDDTEGCNVVDASQFGGISFKLWGDIGEGNTLTLGVSTLGNAISAAWLQSIDDPEVKGTEPGRCVPESGSRYYHPGCEDGKHVFSLTGTEAMPQTVNVKWDEFTGGLPDATVEPGEIVSVYWYVSWADGKAPYDVDFRIDDLALLPKD